MKVEYEDKKRIKITHDDGLHSYSFSHENILLYEIMKRLENIERRLSLKVSVRKRLPKVLRREAKRNASRKN